VNYSTTKNQSFKVPELISEGTQRYANVKKKSIVIIIGCLKIGQQNFLLEQPRKKINHEN
jgi:hypothetical protein